jgi:16S rRNA processing protein RimM
MDNTGEEGSVDHAAEPRFLIIGRVVRAHGVRGEMHVTIHTDVPERFTWLERVFISKDEDDQNPRPVPLESVRFHKGNALVKLGGYDSREQVELLRTWWLMVPEEEGIPLEEGEYFLYQLEGLEVYTDEGEHLGTVSEVLQTKANNVFVVQGPAGELLLPDTEEVVLEVDVEAGRITVHLIPGLRP